MDHPMGGHGGHPSGYVLEISSRAEAPFDDARGRDDNAKLTERLTLKVYSLAENKKLTRKSKNRDFSTQLVGHGFRSSPLRRKIRGEVSQRRRSQISDTKNPGLSTRVFAIDAK